MVSILIIIIPFILYRRVTVLTYEYSSDETPRGNIVRYWKDFKKKTEGNFIGSQIAEWLSNFQGSLTWTNWQVIGCCPVSSVSTNHWGLRMWKMLLSSAREWAYLLQLTLAATSLTMLKSNKTYSKAIDMEAENLANGKALASVEKCQMLEDSGE